MKNTLRLFVVGVSLTAFSSVFGATESRRPVGLAQPARFETGQMIVSQKSALTAKELASYKQRELALKEETKQQAAGEAMDTSTMVIIGVLVVVVVVVAATSGGSGGGGGY